MARLFISHSSADNEEAKAFADWLTHNGWEDYFLDFHHTKGLNPGERWQEALKAAADRCEAVVFLISPAWRDSRWCLAEFLLAKQMGKAIFGVLVKPTPLDTLPAEMTAEWQLADWTGDLADGQARLKTGLERAGLDPSTFPWPPPGDPDRAPYRGLKPLEEADAAILFGREADIVRALDTLRQIRDRGDARLMVILGASGAGKSSVLRAGLWPRLKRDTRHFLPLPILRPGRAPLTGETGLAACLEHALAKAGKPEARGQIAADIEARRTEAVRERLVRLQQSALTAPQEDAVPPTLLIALDQAEELFLAGESREAEIVLSALAPLLAPPPEGDEAAGAAARRLLIGVATIRSDTFQSLQQSAQLSGVRRMPFDLPPILPGAYRSIIEGPAKRASDAGHKLVIEPALTERLLRETTGTDALPVLAFTLERLFVQYGSDGDLRLDEYEALGGTSGSIEAAVAEALQSVPGGATLETVRAAFFPWLVRIDTADDAPLRRLARLDELPAQVRPVIDAFITQRLLRTSSADTGEGEETVIEVAHEALLRQWPTLSAWLDEERAALRLISDVQAAALEYDKRESQGERRDFWLIHRGGRLDHAEAALQAPQYQAVLGPSGRAYLAACRALQDRLHTEEREQLEAEKARLAEIASLQKRRARSQRRGFVVNLVFLALVVTSLVGAVLGFRQLHLVQSKVLVTFALAAEKDGQVERALRFSTLAAEGDWLKPPSRDAMSVSAQIASRSVWRGTLQDGANYIRRAAFSSDGKRILTLSSAGTILIWHQNGAGAWTSTGLAGHEGLTTAADVSLDGKRVATATSDGAVRISSQGEDGTWRRTSLDSNHFGSTAFGFSPDGKRIVTIVDDYTVKVWYQTPNGTWKGTVLEGHEGEIRSAAFSSDGTHVVTSSDDRTARVWSESNNGTWTNVVLEGHSDVVWEAEFSPDDARIVTASEDGTSRVWHKHDDGNWISTPLDERKSGASSASFSPDGTRILTVSSDGGAYIWREGKNGKWISYELDGAGPAATSAWFSPDGKIVFAIYGDDPPKIWSGEPADTDSDMTFSKVSAAFAEVSPDTSGQADIESFGETWDYFIPEAHDKQVLEIAFSPIGNQVIVISEDKPARLWDLRFTDALVLDPKGEMQSGAAHICRDRMSRTMHESNQKGTENPELVYTSRVVTSDDIFALPVLEDRLGDDVCASFLEPPPWWRALLFWR